MTSRHVLSTFRCGLGVAITALALGGCGSADDPTKPEYTVHLIPPPGLPPPPPSTPAALVDALAAAYDGRDPARFAALLDRDFLFILDAAAGGPENWDASEEKRIHRRMFRPAEIPASEPPLPPELWVASLDAKLTPQTAFAEHPEYYQSPTNPGGIDPTRAKVWGAEYAYSVLWDTQGETDYLVTGRAWFVVVTSLAPPLGSAPGVTLLRWQDLGGKAVAAGPRSAVAAFSWSALKKLYQ